MIFFASLLIIDLLVIGNFFGIEEVVERLQQTSVESEGRVDVFRDSLSIVRDYPLTGTGAGSFYSVYPMYDSGNTGFAFYRHTHNDYVQFASELRLPAFALLGFGVLASLWSAIRAQLTRRDRLLQVEIHSGMDQQGDDRHRRRKPHALQQAVTASQH